MLVGNVTDRTLVTGDMREAMLSGFKSPSSSPSAVRVGEGGNWPENSFCLMVFATPLKYYSRLVIEEKDLIL